MDNVLLTTNVFTNKLLDAEQLDTEQRDTEQRDTKEIQEEMWVPDVRVLSYDDLVETYEKIKSILKNYTLSKEQILQHKKEYKCVKSELEDRRSKYNMNSNFEIHDEEGDEILDEEGD